NRHQRTFQFSVSETAGQAELRRIEEKRLQEKRDFEQLQDEQTRKRQSFFNFLTSQAPQFEFAKYLGVGGSGDGTNHAWASVEQARNGADMLETRRAREEAYFWCTEHLKLVQSDFTPGGLYYNNAYKNRGVDEAAAPGVMRGGLRGLRRRAQQDVETKALLRDLAETTIETVLETPLCRQYLLLNVPDSRMEHTFFQTLLGMGVCSIGENYQNFRRRQDFYHDKFPKSRLGGGLLNAGIMELHIR
ncbi:unnamed protein product, partial [Amoebophrya sp. A120]